jgi:hypothetical protein
MKPSSGTGHVLAEKTRYALRLLSHPALCPMLTPDVRSGSDVDNVPVRVADEEKRRAPHASSVSGWMIGAPAPRAAACTSLVDLVRIPRAEAGQPGRDGATVRLVLGAEALAESRFLVAVHEGRHERGCGRDGRDRGCSCLTPVWPMPNGGPGRPTPLRPPLRGTPPDC